MVELVDTQDLKSCDLKSRAGSIPALSTNATFTECCVFFCNTLLWVINIYAEILRGINQPLFVCLNICKLA